MIDFLKYRWICGLFSLSIMLLFVGLYTYKKITYGHAFTYSVEFTGGTQLLFGFNKKVSSNQLLDILAANGWSGASTREFANNEVLVRIKDFSHDTTALAERIKTIIMQQIPDLSITILQVDSIGEGMARL